MANLVDEGMPEEKKILQDARDMESLKAHPGFQAFMEHVGEKAVNAIEDILTAKTSEQLLSLQGQLVLIASLWEQIDATIGLSRVIQQRLEERTRAANEASSRQQQRVDGRAARAAYDSGVL